MKVSRLIKQLQKCNPNAEVKLHYKEGFNVLFVVSYEGLPDVVVIEDKSDDDLRSELSDRFSIASENNMDELDFFMDLLETGFTLEDIKNYLPEEYDYSLSFMESHGLI